jgi:hypothetical protein
VVIDPADQLGLGAVSQPDAADDVQLPQLHWGLALPAAPVAAAAAPAGLDQVVADQDAIDPRPRRHRRPPAALELMLEPQRSPARMLAAQLTHLSFDLDRGLMGTGPRAMGAILQPGQSISLIAAQPAMDRLATHPVAVGHLSDRHPAQHLLDSGIALLDHTQLPQHPWPPWPRRQGRQHKQTERRCQASAETLETISRDRPVKHHPSQHTC